MHLNVAFLGFGNVGRAVADLLLSKADTLKADYDLEFSVTGISTGRHGMAINQHGLDLQSALDTVKDGGSLAELSVGPPATVIEDWLARLPADLVFETIPTNPEDGEPALSYVRTLVKRGIHVVTANKGPAVFAHRELTDIARANGAGFFFESTVMGGVPVIALVREGLPGATCHRISGILNSTTNYILDRMGSEGITYEEALAGAQAIGVAETDPTLDVDGWDSAIKIAILANLAMGVDLRPADVNRTGIRGISLQQIQNAAADGECYRLLCEAVREGDGVKASVRPQRVPLNGPYGQVHGTGSVARFETDTLADIALVDGGLGLTATAYGLVADMINLVRGRG